MFTTFILIYASYKRKALSKRIHTIWGMKNKWLFKSTFQEVKGVMVTPTWSVCSWLDGITNTLQDELSIHLCHHLHSTWGTADMINHILMGYHTLIKQCSWMRYFCFKLCLNKAILTGEFKIMWALTRNSNVNTIWKKHGAGLSHNIKITDFIVSCLWDFCHVISELWMMEWTLWAVPC